MRGLSQVGSVPRGLYGGLGALLRGGALSLAGLTMRGSPVAPDGSVGVLRSGVLALRGGILALRGGVLAPRRGVLALRRGVLALRRGVLALLCHALAVRRRPESISRIRTRISSPGWTISRGLST